VQLFIIDKYSCFGDKKPSLFLSLLFNLFSTLTKSCSEIIIQIPNLEEQEKNEGFLSTLEKKLL